MVNTNRPDKNQIFGRAAELRDPAERAAYLRDVCGQDAALQAEIEELLEHDQQPDSFLDARPPGADATADSQLHNETVGTRIGRHKLLQEIGQGGMGTVFWPSNWNRSSGVWH